MFHYRQSVQQEFDTACRRFAMAHNLVVLADKTGMNVRVLRNKLNPEQVHKLCWDEILNLTEATSDPTLLDGLLAQANCQPSIPLFFETPGNLTSHVLAATSAVGELAKAAASNERLTQSKRASIKTTVNNLIRTAALVGIAIESRYQASAPGIAMAMDVIHSAGAALL